ncbi:hypothetical protein CASFOL_025450 [Castilleja foliolosa]|uniref:Tim44-like domain-containing protein n=1 Tax=Castilleja foliolosa TaxID=1961234 RepID=A0ABD3CR48_9LAMI
MSFKEIRRRDPNFSLPEFVADIARNLPGRTVTKNRRARLFKRLQFQQQQRDRIADELAVHRTAGDETMVYSMIDGCDGVLPEASDDVVIWDGFWNMDDGDIEVLKKYCAKNVIERCKAEHNAFAKQGIFFDNKILHILDVEIRETKMMGDTPIIIVVFQTQQVYCIRDKHGEVTEGGKLRFINVLLV